MVFPSSPHTFFWTNFLFSKDISIVNVFCKELHLLGEVLRLKVKAETKVITVSYANYITKNQLKTIRSFKNINIIWRRSNRQYDTS
eukprot:Pgem_evm1s6087